jgi:hypothetical protein
MSHATSSKPFEVETFLATVGPGRRTVALRAHDDAFSAGGAADSMFYLRFRTGAAKRRIKSGERGYGDAPRSRRFL